jgi:hypothetical protein
VLLRWEDIYLSNSTTDIGSGFFIKLLDCNLQSSDKNYELPILQLSPGSYYSTPNYTILWSSDGKLIVNEGYQLQGLCKILRYE